MALGKVVHWGIDLVLVSTALAGIRRSTGWRFNSESISDSKSVQEYTDKYLFIGEKAINYAAWQMKAFPKYFTKD